MATIFGVTSLELTEEQEKALSAALIKDLGTLYTHALSFYLSKIPQEDARGGAVDQITFFVCVPPYIPLEKKRQTIELLNNTMVREVGYKGCLIYTCQSQRDRQHWRIQASELIKKF